VSDTPQGPGWWQASDGKYYPPEQAPGYQQPGTTPSGGVDVGAALSYGWNKFTQNIGELLVIWLVLVAVRIVFGALNYFLGVGTSFGSFGSRFFIGFGLYILDGIIAGVLMIPLARAAMAIVNGQKVDVGQAFQLSGPPLVGGIVFGLLLGVGYALCGLPALVVWFLFGLTPIVAVAENKGADALGVAMNIVTSRFGEFFLILLVAGLLTLCTYYLLAPFAFISMAYLYKTHRGEPVAP
jgi:hypothetical protein